MSLPLRDRLEQLNPQQRKIVEWDTSLYGPALALAGAGTGKTTVLTLRVLNLIEQQVPSQSIFCATYTVKAALELKERLCSLDTRAQDVWAGTLHSLALQVLKDPIAYEYLGMNQAPIPMDEAQGASQNEELAKHFIKLDEIIPLCNQVLVEVPTVSNKWRSHVGHLLLDEAQDMDPSQHLLADLLSTGNPNVLWVGDDDQAIYGFRGASPQGMLDYAARPNVTTLKLEMNYRSSAAILDLANQLFKDKELSHQKHLLPGGKQKGPKPQNIYHRDGVSEIQFLVQLIGQFAQLGIPAHQFCVLCRLNRQVEYYKAALLDFGIQTADEVNPHSGITIQTIHASKGLEYTCVVCIGLEKGVFPDPKAHDPTEELRLFYVAITRAKNFLWLSSCRSKTIHGQTRTLQPSPFLKWNHTSLLQRFWRWAWFSTEPRMDASQISILQP